MAESMTTGGVAPERAQGEAWFQSLEQERRRLPPRSSFRDPVALTL